LSSVVRPLPDWDRALGPALFCAVIRTEPADFKVAEELSIEFSEDGEHDFLWIEKTSANTQWVAQCLARHARVPIRDVGFAGLKDRHAITRQWFSVRRPGRAGTNWQEFVAEGVHIQERHIHRRKLKRGAHKGNSFCIVLRGNDITPHRKAIAERLERIKAGGVPNYFGEQRFGRDGGNMNLARELFGGHRLPRPKRSIALSAARSYLFNEILARRVRQGSWNTILAGELANLDGSASVFSVDEPDDELIARCLAMDIHPSGTLWGDNAPKSSQDVADIERAVAGANTELVDGLQRARVDASSRALRLPVRDLSWEFANDTLQLEFSLGRGGFATAVLREMAQVKQASRT
jgi:tRNA pseudouridine13 synthase